MSKRITAIILTVLLMLTMAPRIFAADALTVDAVYDQAANRLIISGNTAPGASRPVLLIVEGPGGYFYINSADSESDGSYQLSYIFDGVTEGTYTVNAYDNTENTHASKSFAYNTASPSPSPSVSPSPSPSESPSPDPSTSPSASPGNTPASAPTPTPITAGSPVSAGEANKLAKDLSETINELKSGKTETEKVKAIEKASDKAANAIAAVVGVTDEEAKTVLVEEIVKALDAILDTAAGLENDASINNASKALSAILDKVAAAAAAATGQDDILTLLDMVRNVVSGAQALIENISTVDAAAKLTESILNTASKAITGVEGSDAESKKAADEIIKLADKVVEKAGRQDVAADVKGNSAEISASDINVDELLERAEAAVKTANELQKLLDNNNINGSIERKLVIGITSDKEIDEVNAELPADLLTKAGEKGIDRVEISSGIATLSIPPAAIDANDAAKILLQIREVNKETELNPEQRKIAGDNTVYDFSAMLTDSAGNTRKLSSFYEKLEIRLPYQLKEGENPDNITVFYINDRGELENISGVYDPATGTVIFKTDHFSIYFAAVNIVRFSDIAENFWGRVYIEALASKGIINGKKPGAYVPQDFVTRAEFAKLITVTFGLVDSEAAASYTDVNSDAWYYIYVASAEKAGLLKDIAGSTFNPNQPISREDMAVMAARAHSYLKNVKTSDIDAKLAFKDKDDIAAYAKEPIANCVRYGILTGKPGNIMDPKGTATRAEAAAIIYRLLKL